MSRSVASLVGRDEELATLVGLLDRAASREAGAVLVAGDAGVGKTRLLTELLATASSRGMLTLTGHCLDFGDAGLPYLPFTEVFGRLAAVSRDLPASFGPLQRLLPGRRVLASSAAGGAVASEERLDRTELFDSVLTTLADLSVEQPVLLVVEDAHWADQATRDLLGFLLSRLGQQRLAVVVSYRTDDLHRRHPLRTVVAEWARMRRVSRLDLGPLSDSEIGVLARQLRSAPLAEEQLGQIVARADGNAFFAEELVAASEHAADTGALPAELAELLLVKLDRLPEPAREVVRQAAVAGRTVSHDVLAIVSGSPSSALEDALRAAVDAHVLTSAGTRGYGFRHALLGEAAYDDLLPGERTRLHAAFAEALRHNPSAGTAAELARHALASHDLATAYRASIDAGDEAIAIAAPQDALTHYEAALKLERAVDASARDADPDRLVLAAADAAASAGHVLRGLQLATAALDELPTDAADLRRAGLLAAVTGYELRMETGSGPFVHSGMGLRLVPPQPPSELRARLAALHARASMFAGRDAEALRWATEAFDSATELEEYELVAEAQTTLAVLRRRSGDPEGAGTILIEVIAAAKRDGHVAAELRSTFNLANLYYEQGRLDAAARLFEEAHRRASEAGLRWAAFGLDSRTMHALIEYERGNWQESLQLSAFDGQSPPALVQAQFLAVQLAVRSGQGQVHALELMPRIRRGWGLDGMVAMVATPPAMDLLVGSGRHEQAARLHDEVVGLLVDAWQDEWFLGRIRLAAMMMAALTSGLVGAPAAERERAVHRGLELIGRAHATVEHGLGGGRRLGVEGIAWLARAEAEWARLRWRAGVDGLDADEHVALWRRSVEAFGYGNVFEKARSAARLASVLQAVGDIAQARTVAGEALAFARAAGAQPLLAELAQLAGSAVPAKAAGGGAESLTDREREVLGLLVQARTNRQIARELYISEKTVSVHVSNILAKLGVRSRAEAAALARQ